MKEVAIIGSTASGKSDLAITLAQRIDAYILSLDSLSIYKEIDIVSAKPSKEELSSIKHFGVDVIWPDEAFNVETFIKCYEQTKQACLKDGKHLVIVGGTSFYLKAMLDGISPLPKMSETTIVKTKELLSDTQKAHTYLKTLDALYASKIEPTDRYRLEKALLIHFQTELTPTEYFKKNKAKPVLKNTPVFQIDVDKEVLRERINVRTKKMFALGLIDEVVFLEHKYTRAPNCMKAIGIRESLDFLDGLYTKDELLEKIATNTARLAKRQRTFNKSQFQEVQLLDTQSILKEALNLF